MEYRLLCVFLATRCLRTTVADTAGLLNDFTSMCESIHEPLHWVDRMGWDEYRGSFLVNIPLPVLFNTIPSYSWFHTYPGFTIINHLLVIHGLINIWLWVNTNLQFCGK